MLPRSPSSETTKPPSPASCAMASAPSRSTSRPFRSSSLLSPRRSTSALRHHSRRPGRRGEPSGRRKQGASRSSDPELLVGSAPTAPPVTTESPAGAGLSPTGATGLEPATPGFGDVERECCFAGKRLENRRCAPLCAPVVRQTSRGLLPHRTTRYRRERAGGGAAALALRTQAVDRWGTSTLLPVGRSIYCPASQRSLLMPACGGSDEAAFTAAAV